MEPSGKRVFSRKGIDRIILVTIPFLCAGVFHIFVYHSGVNRFPPAKFEKMLDGTAEKPFCYRILLPKTVRLIHRVIPAARRAAIDETLYENKFLSPYAQRMELPWWLSTEMLIALVLAYLSLVGYSYLLYLLARTLYKERPFVAWIAPVLGLLAIPPNLHFGYLYDFPVLLISAAMLLAIARRTWFLYLGLFALGCLNKETAVLMVLPFSIYVYRQACLSPRIVVFFAAAQVGFFCLVRTVQSVLFRNNAGLVMYKNFATQLNGIFSHYTYTDLASFLLLVVLLFHRFSEKPTLLRFFLVLSIPLFVLFLLGGNPGEFRVFYELHSVLVLLSAHTLSLFVGSGQEWREQPTTAGSQ